MAASFRVAFDPRTPSRCPSVVSEIQQSPCRWSFTGRKPRQDAANLSYCSQKTGRALHKVLAAQSRFPRVRADANRLPAQRQGVADSNPSICRQAEAGSNGSKSIRAPNFLLSRGNQLSGDILVSAAMRANDEVPSCSSSEFELYVRSDYRS